MAATDFHKDLDSDVMDLCQYVPHFPHTQTHTTSQLPSFSLPEIFRHYLTRYITCASPRCVDVRVAQLVHPLAGGALNAVNALQLPRPQMDALVQQPLQPNFTRGGHIMPQGTPLMTAAARMASRLME